MTKLNDKLLFFLTSPHEKTIPLYLQKENINIEIHLFDSQALSKINTLKPKGCIFDFDKNENDFLEIAHAIKKNNTLSKIRILFYTGINDQFFELACYEAGVDLFVNKPKKNRIFYHIINRLIWNNDEKNKVENDEKTGLQIDRERFLVIKDGIYHNLSKKEFDLLELLFKRPGKVFTRSEIASAIWDGIDASKTRTIDVHIRKLRDKLGGELIKTIKGVGYSLEL